MKYRKIPRISPVFTALAVLAALIVAFSQISCFRKDSAQSRGAAEFRYGFMSEPATLDPLSPANTADGRSILFNVFEGLVKPDTEGRLLPCLAESITVDGNLYHFTLRKNVRFHDGSFLTAADVLFSLETAIAAGFYGFSAIEKIEAKGDHEILIALKQPDPEFLPYLILGIAKANSTNRDTNAIGTGPYLIESYNRQQSLILKRFNDYWQFDVPSIAPKREGFPLDKITIVFFADADALMLGLYAGNIDGAGLPSGALTQQLNPDQFEKVPGFSAMVQLLALNNASPPLNDIRVRQAINYGIDIQGIIDTAFYGEGQPSGSPLIPGLSVYYEESLANPYPVNHERAISLLSDAGYGEGKKKLSLEITVPSNYTMHVDTAQVIANQLTKVGINVNIKLVDWATWLSDVYFGRNYQATIISLDSPYVSPKGFLSRYYSSDTSNFINFSNTVFDQVFDMILNETDEEKRIALYKRAQRIISANVASVYIQDIRSFRVFRIGAYGGVLNYPLSAVDFAAMYAK